MSVCDSKFHNLAKEKLWKVNKGNVEMLVSTVNVQYKFCYIFIITN